MKSPSDFFLALQDTESGGFRFASQSPPTLIATAYSVLGLESAGTLNKLDPKKKSQIVSFIFSGLSSDGHFRDPLFRYEDVLSREHDRSYFEEETTAFCLQALDALEEKGPTLNFPEALENPQRLVAYLKSMLWENPWLDSNRVMFALSRICYEAEKQGQVKRLAAVDEALDWLDTQQSEKTGLWHGYKGAGLSTAMAATVHFTFFYIYRRRPIPCADQIINSCLSLQASHGLFSRTTVGHTCFDYDAIQLLYTVRALTDHRKKEVNAAMKQASATTQSLQNEDGGFADAKIQIRHLFGRPPPMFLSKKIRNGIYNNCWKHLSCPSAESNAYSTWLRMLTLVLTSDGAVNPHSFRRLPFLGYRPS